MTIDKTDNLYDYLTDLGVEETDIEKYYLFFATNGYIEPQNIQDFVNYETNGGFEVEYDETILKDLVSYYNLIKKEKKLSTSELKKLLIEYEQTGCEHCAEHIITNYLSWVVNAAYAFKIKHPELDIKDLLQVGNIGLIRALKKYSSKTNIAFEDYLAFWVRDEIYKEFFTKDEGENE